MKGSKHLLVAAISAAALFSSSGASAYCYFGYGTTCGDDTSGAPAPGGSSEPTPLVDKNPNNKLDSILTYSGKNYNVLVTGSDLVKDKNGDGQADGLKFPRTSSVNIPSGATIEAAFLIYSGTIYYNDGGYNVKDDTNDTIGGAAAALDNANDAANNKIDFSINGSVFNDVTPASMGGNSRSTTSWWYMHAREGTLKDSKVGFYSNRLDITNHVANLSGNVSFSVTDLQRADFAGNKKDSGEYWSYYPAGNNGNGEAANDCISSVNYSVVIIYSKSTGAAKTVSLMEGVAWAWQTDFATSYSKAYNYSMVKGPLVLDVTMNHAAVKASAGANIYIGAIDGDPYNDDGARQCGSASIPHSTGHDHTWVTSGTGKRNYYQDIYEGTDAPANGGTISGYNNVTSVAKGINYNVTKIAVQDIQDGATKTLLHVEGDSEDSTDAAQEALLLNFVIFEGTKK